MANGDAAAAVGMDTVAGTEDIRQGYDEINKSRDYIANHITDGAHRANQITTGTLAVARGGTGRSNVFTSEGTGDANKSVSRLAVVNSAGLFFGLVGDVGPEYLGFEFHFGMWSGVEFDAGQAVEPHGADFTPTLVICQSLQTAAGGLTVVSARADNEPANAENVFLRGWGVAGPLNTTVSKIMYLVGRAV